MWGTLLCCSQEPLVLAVSTVRFAITHPRLVDARVCFVEYRVLLTGEQHLVTTVDTVAIVTSELTACNYTCCFCAAGPRSRQNQRFVADQK